MVQNVNSYNDEHVENEKIQRLYEVVHGIREDFLNDKDVTGQRIYSTPYETDVQLYESDDKNALLIEGSVVKKIDNEVLYPVGGTISNLVVKPSHDATDEVLRRKKVANAVMNLIENHSEVFSRIDFYNSNQFEIVAEDQDVKTYRFAQRIDNNNLVIYHTVNYRDKNTETEVNVYPIGEDNGSKIIRLKPYKVQY